MVRPERAHGFRRPNLAGRLYLRLDGADRAAQIFYILDITGRVDPAALRRALAGLLDDIPQLRSRVVRRWYGYRREIRAAEDLRDADLDAILTVSAGENAVDAFLQRPPNLRGEPPIHVLLHQGRAHDELVVAVHHSVTDGRGMLIVLARLGERYEEAMSGTPAPPATPPRPEPRYRDLLASLAWRDRWTAFRRAVRYVRDGARLPGSPAPVALATFLDVPLPARGRLRYVRIGLSVQQVARLTEWATARQCTRTDVLLTASLCAALRVWPAQAARPIAVSLPVNLRSAADVDVANRVGVLDFQVRAGTFDTILAQVSTATARARERRPAIVNVFTFALASCLPPAVFEWLARRYFNQTVNVRESLTFTYLGGASGGPQRFGPAIVADSVLLSSVVAPPGVKIQVSPHGGRLNLSVAYLDPAISPASVSAFTAAVRAELDALG